MLKMYDNQDHAGDTSDFWEDNWSRIEFERSLRFCAVDPLRPLFERYLRPDSLMLEGGCGFGHYVTYYTRRGHRVVGVDFAQNTLKTLKGRLPDGMLCGGDVSRLPFADETFDLYYSGGVVEHFESGATASLSEARRVLKPDGTLLISVPYYSPLRRALRPFKKKDWRWVREASADNGREIPAGKKFFQYAYTPDEFQMMLAEAGLTTIDKQGYAVIWGLYELPFVGASGNGPAANVENQNSMPTAASSVDSPGERSGLVRRLVVSEDDSVPVLGLGVKVMRWAASNMMMYVCVRA